MGSYPLEDVLDCAYYEVLPLPLPFLFLFLQLSQEDCHPKRRRNHYHYDDSEDYSEGHRHRRRYGAHYRSKQPNSNKVEGLLEWRHQLEMLPITVNYLPGQTEVSLQ